MTRGTAEPEPEAGAAEAVRGAARRAVSRSGRRRFARLLAVLLSLVTFAPAGPAAAATPSISVNPSSVCTGRPDRVLEFSTGELRVYKNRRYACAVTIAKNPGPRRKMSVSIQARGGHPRVDEGRFTHRAGPVTVHALNRCVRASGKVSGVGRSTGWILC
ncbi:hypothetical protein GCM10010387_59330 [Streptomyces inusitatus]|uniref:Secreted protein n=1 Tax=Streptomyces inusitatus TaxID=68221 RepID=A0A918QKV4_9ACTN|nr:hypothetical protein [Streptomyces inusitatus]GGZ57485.1 hypothetical protein GCM10010387_59330 [Streptomyces inusitatus]